MNVEDWGIDEFRQKYPKGLAEYAEVIQSVMKVLEIKFDEDEKVQEKKFTALKESGDIY